MFKISKLFFHLLLLLGFAFSFSGCTLFKKWEHLPTTQEDERSLYLTNTGWHTGLVIASVHLDKRFDFLKSRFGYSEFYEFGWGDKAYYEAKEITSGMRMQAVFWPTDSVMHVVAVPILPKLYFPESQSLELKVSKEGLEHLIQYILDSFKRDGKGAVIDSKRGLYRRSFFYDGEDSFYMTNTCNTWTAKGLDKAGLPVSSFLTISAGSVMRQTEDAIERYPKIP